MSLCVSLVSGYLAEGKEREMDPVGERYAYKSDSPSAQGREGLGAGCLPPQGDISLRFARGTLLPCACRADSSAGGCLASLTRQAPALAIFGPLLGENSVERTVVLLLIFKT